jgi:ATP-dependent helicase HrpA
MAQEIEQAAGKVLLREAARPPLPIRKTCRSARKNRRFSRPCATPGGDCGGETGSGKTTQLPKSVWSWGAVKGLIGHTQPRRLAARTVANRIAEELQTEPGGCIGYKVRLATTSAITPWSS